MINKVKQASKIVVIVIISMILYMIFFKSKPVIEKTWMGFVLDESQLLLRKDSFNMVNLEGEKIGSMVMVGTLIDTNYIWKDISILDSIVYEETTYTFDKETYSLLNSTIEFSQEETTISGNLDWSSRVTGIYEIIQRDQSRSVEVDTTYACLRDRAEVFAFIQAIPLKTGLKFPINVLVQPNGEIWEMDVEVMGEEKCTVPAGEFDTFKINLTGGKLSNVLYVSKGDSRKLVKVEVVDQPIIIELISSKK
jgi:hypothetical protein